MRKAVDKKFLTVCQLPIHLLDRLLLMTTDENDIVLDPFLGTGTTAISAKRLGRRYIGFELNQHYVDIAINKLNRVEPNFIVNDVWVSFYLNEIVTIRDKDWENLSDCFELPITAKDIDYQRIKLKKCFAISTEGKNRDNILSSINGHNSYGNVNKTNYNSENHATLF